MNTGLFTSAYLAPISYYKKMLSYDEVMIEQHNNYERKTFQNRCEILSANGKIALSVPVEKSRDIKTPAKDVLIANHTPWQSQHYKAIISAYHNSPFCEYYIDELVPFYEKEFKYLLDFNQALQACILDQFDIQQAIALTSSYHDGSGIDDLRYDFAPRIVQSDSITPYVQVFADKTGFVPDLSILDLLFNIGPAYEDFL